MRITLRLPDELGEKVKAQAEDDERSLNGEIVWLLRAKIDEKVILRSRHQADTTPPPDVQLTNLARGTQEAATPDIYEKMSHNLVPPLDAQGIPPDSAKGKTTAVHHAALPQHRVGLPANPTRPLGDAPKPTCTCGPGERAKGKHNKKCPARGT